MLDRPQLFTTGVLSPAQLPGPRPDQRMVIVGPAGSGKTTVAQYLLPRYPYGLALDPKAEFHLSGAHVHTSYRTVLRLRDPQKEPWIVYQPTVAELRDPRAHDRIFWWAYLRRNTMVYVDEVYAFTTSTEMPEGLFAIITRGRSRMVGGIFATQRPSRIPLVVLSEARCAIIFRLQLAKDRKRIEETFYVPERDQLRLQEYEWLFALDGRTYGPYRLAIPQRAA